MEEKIGKYYDIISGFAFKSEDLKDSADIPVIKIGNISNGRSILSDSMQFVDRELLWINSKYHIKRGDVLLSLTGSHINQPNSMVGRSCRNYEDEIFLLNQRAGKVIPKEDASLDYIYYVLQTKAMKESIVCRAYGAANQVNVSPKAVMGIKWDFPDASIQRHVGAILSAYDNLIENNNKRIRLLEQMAENLYKEWFVRFRFPGHKKVEMENGLPKGWKIEKLKDVIIEQPKSKIQVGEVEGNNGQYPFYTSGRNILQYNNFLVDGENILLNTGGIADVKYSRGKIHYSTDTWCIKGINNCTLFLYMYLQGILPEINASYFEGAALKHLKKSSFKKKKLILPPSTLINEFDLSVSALYKEIFLLRQNNQLLTRQRDLLLPRLMSGKLEVKE